MSKNKKSLRPTRTDLYAISPLPIHFIEKRLARLSKRGIDMQVTDLSSDGRAFQLTHPKMRSITTGTLRRWEGAQPLIEFDGTEQSLEKMLRRQRTRKQ
ncbi:MAG: hypothetical protein Q9P01_07895 [Anaerolineae bacterium]|nr:hypothetical protein [Anaerolineae bacterium]MDQ7034748.1 hypothetical protein [Anaerolineae bacterium]